MKKLIIFLLLIGCLSVSVFAFDIMSYPPPVSNGDILIDAGVGLGIASYKGNLKIPPLFAQVEYALSQVPISVGGAISFWQYGSPNYTYNHFAILGRGNWHWGFDVDWLDLYSGLSLGYKAGWETDRSGPSPTTSRTGYFDWGLQFGAHFYFTPKIGAMVEIGYPMMRLGLAFKL
jgi:hypothetical protein